MSAPRPPPLGAAYITAAALALACSEPPRPLSPRPESKLSPAELERWTAFFARYLALDTTNPPGNEALAFPLLEEALRGMGLTSTVTALGEGRGNLHARLRPTRASTKGPVVLLHHIDVVPVERDRWTMPPFGGETRDGKIYGRGAIDMKLVGVLQLAALEMLARHRDRLEREVIWLAVSDEEVHGAGAQLAIERYWKEWLPDYLLDEGGFAVRDFMNGRDVLVIATTQKRPMKLALVAKGEAGHGSRPIPRGGPRVLAEALHRLDQHPPAPRLISTNVHLFEALGGIAPFPKSLFLSHLSWPGMLWLVEGGLSANKNLNPLIRDTLTPTMLEAGQKANVIPAEARAVLDVRLLPDTRLEDLLADLRATLSDLPVELEVVEAPGPAVPEAPTKDPLYVGLTEAVRAHAPETSVAPWTVVGANDSRFFAPLGVKTYGFVPVFLSKAQLDTIHGHDENVDLRELALGLSIYADALARTLLSDDSRGPQSSGGP